MHILIDGYFITKGLSRSCDVYISRILQGLSLHDDVKVIMTVRHDVLEKVRRQWGEYDIDYITLDEEDVRCFQSKYHRLMGKAPFLEEVEKREVDIVLTPMFNIYSFIFPKKYRQYGVVHDFIYMNNLKKTYGKLRMWYEWFFLRLLSRKLYGLISISKETQKEVERLVGRSSTLIYNSIPAALNAREISERIISGRYILDVNRIVEEKNPQTLVRAFALIKDKLPHSLYFKGFKNGYYLNSLKDLVHGMGLDDRVIIDVEDRSPAEIASLYVYADLLVTPSLMEGFGYTPIEAAIYKTPALVSDIPILREVTRGKMPTFNPESHELLAEKMLEMINHPQSEKELASLSDFFIEEYSVEKQTHSFLKLFNQKT